MNTGLIAVSLLPSLQRTLPPARLSFPQVGKGTAVPRCHIFQFLSLPDLRLGSFWTTPMQCLPSTPNPTGSGAHRPPPGDAALVCASPNMLSADSLLKDFLPVALDKVPGQRLPEDVAGNAVNGGGGILLPDEVWVQGVTQVPVRTACCVISKRTLPSTTHTSPATSQHAFSRLRVKDSSVLPPSCRWDTESPKQGHWLC